MQKNTLQGDTERGRERVIERGRARGWLDVKRRQMCALPFYLPIWPADCRCSAAKCVCWGVCVLGCMCVCVWSQLASRVPYAMLYSL